MEFLLLSALKSLHDPVMLKCWCSPLHVWRPSEFCSFTIYLLRDRVLFLKELAWNKSRFDLGRGSSQEKKKNGLSSHILSKHDRKLFYTSKLFKKLEHIMLLLKLDEKRTKQFKKHRPSLTPTRSHSLPSCLGFWALQSWQNHNCNENTWPETDSNRGFSVLDIKLVCYIHLIGIYA